MKVLKERIDDDIFVDLILGPKDELNLRDQSVQPVHLTIGPMKVHLWVRTANNNEVDDWLDEFVDTDQD